MQLTEEYRPRPPAPVDLSPTAEHATLVRALLARRSHLGQQRGSALAIELGQRAAVAATDVDVELAFAFWRAEVGPEPIPTFTVDDLLSRAKTGVCTCGQMDPSSPKCNRYCSRTGDIATCAVTR